MGKQVSSTDGTAFFFFFFSQGHWQTNLYNPSSVSFNKNVVIRGLQEPNPVFPVGAKFSIRQFGVPGNLMSLPHVTRIEWTFYTSIAWLAPEFHPSLDVIRSRVRERQPVSASSRQFSVITHRHR